MTKFDDVAEYFFFSIVWVLGVAGLVFLGFYAGYMTAKMPENLNSPYDGLVSGINNHYVYKGISDMKTENDITKSVLNKINIVLFWVTIVSLVIIEIGSRKVYKLLPRMKLYKRLYLKKLRGVKNESDSTDMD